MITLKTQLRKEFKRKTKSIKGEGKIPAVVYGPKVKNVSLEVDEKEFKTVFREAGESSLIELLVEGDLSVEKSSNQSSKRPVLVHEIQKDPVSGKIIHIDFFQPSLTEKVEVNIPLVFEGIAKAEKDLGGTLMKNIMEIEVKGLPQNLPHEIKVSIESLNTFEDHILIKDLILPEGLEVLKKPEEIVASVLPPQKIEEELAEEIKEDVDSVEKVEKPKEEEEVVEEEIK